MDKNVYYGTKSRENTSLFIGADTHKWQNTLLLVNTSLQNPDQYLKKLWHKSYKDAKELEFFCIFNIIRWSNYCFDRLEIKQGDIWLMVWPSRHFKLIFTELLWKWVPFFHTTSCKFLFKINFKIILNYSFLFSISKY